MSQTSPRGLLYHLPPRKASRKPAALREGPPTAPLPFPIRRIPPSPIVPEPLRLPAGLSPHLVHHAACLELLFGASPEAAAMLLPVIQAVTATHPKTAIRS